MHNHDGDSTAALGSLGHAGCRQADGCPRGVGQLHGGRYMVPGVCLSLLCSVQDIVTYTTSCRLRGSTLRSCLHYEVVCTRRGGLVHYEVACILRSSSLRSTTWSTSYNVPQSTLSKVIHSQSNPLIFFMRIDSIQASLFPNKFRSPGRFRDSGTPSTPSFPSPTPFSRVITPELRPFRTFPFVLGRISRPCIGSGYILWGQCQYGLPPAGILPVKR